VPASSAAPIFDSLWKDLLLAAGLGAIGGVALGLLQEKGLEVPYWRKLESVWYMNLGFLGDIGIGAVAAVVGSTINPAVNLRQLVGLSIVAGIGGTGVLRGYVKGSEAKISQQGAAAVSAVAKQEGGATAQRVEAVQKAVYSGAWGEKSGLSDWSLLKASPRKRTAQRKRR
jgi:hypothetical protein